MLASLVAVFDDTDFSKRHQSLGDILIDKRHKLIEVLMSIDDFNHYTLIQYYKFNTVTGP